MVYADTFAMVKVWRCCLFFLVMASSVWSLPLSNTKNETSEMLQNILQDMALKQDLLERQISGLQGEISRLRDVLRGLGDGRRSSEVVRLEIPNARTRRQAQHMRYRRQIPVIAFQASLMEHTHTVDMKEAIKFDHVITNNGHAYDQATGVFTAPVTGLYFFSTTIVAQTGDYVEASIQRNGMPQVTAVSDHRTQQENDTRGWDQGSAVSVIELNQGDTVTVGVIWPHGQHKISGAGKSSFCGYLLHR